MGCYGIGLGRVLGTVVEVLGDEKGLVWPDAISPFGVHIVELGGSGDDIVRKESQKLYDELISKGIEVLWDDRDLRAGEKFAESDLIGIPLRVVVSSKTIASESFEIKNRATGEVSLVGKDELMAMCKAK